MSHKKIGPDRFSRFDVYWIQTNRQTDKAKLYIDTVPTRSTRYVHCTVNIQTVRRQNGTPNE